MRLGSPLGLHRGQGSIRLSVCPWVCTGRCICLIRNSQNRKGVTNVRPHVCCSETENHAQFANSMRGSHIILSGKSQAQKIDIILLLEHSGRGKAHQ